MSDEGIINIVPEEKSKEEKKAEELEAKKKAFADNPDRFICADDLIIAAIRVADEGKVFAIACPKNDNEFALAQGKINEVIHKVYLSSFLAQKPAIEVPKPRIRDIFRKGH